MAAAARTLASFVKLEHTVFALPFAYIGMLLAADATAGVSVTWALAGWITLAMVGARTLAMSLNRLVDAEIDARNPRTAVRELPSGRLKPWHGWMLAAVSLALLIVAISQLDPVTWWLWPIPVALFVTYPYAKRVTWLCHALLGLTIGLAPAAAWLASGAAASDPVPWLMWLGIAAWIGGFDVIYATGDVEFDRAEGLHSVPARFGVARALMAVRVAHAAAIACFVAVGVLAGLGIGWWIGVAIAAGLLAWENAIVSADDLSRVDVAFFTVNSWVGVVLGIGALAGLA